MGVVDKLVISCGGTDHPFQIGLQDTNDTGINAILSSIPSALGIYVYSHTVNGGAVSSVLSADGFGDCKVYLWKDGVSYENNGTGCTTIDPLQLISSDQPNMLGIGQDGKLVSIPTPPSASIVTLPSDAITIPIDVSMVGKILVVPNSGNSISLQIDATFNGIFFLFNDNVEPVFVTKAISEQFMFGQSVPAKSYSYFYIGDTNEYYSLSGTGEKRLAVGSALYPPDLSNKELSNLTITYVYSGAKTLDIPLDFPYDRWITIINANDNSVSFVLSDGMTGGYSTSQVFEVGGYGDAAYPKYVVDPVYSISRQYGFKGIVSILRVSNTGKWIFK